MVPQSLILRRDKMGIEQCIQIAETYKLNNSLWDILKKIKNVSKSDHGDFHLDKEGIVLYGTFKCGSCEVTSEFGRIVTGEVIGKPKNNLYLQIYVLERGEPIEKIKPNYVDLLRDFIC